MPQHEILHPEYVKIELAPKVYPCSKCPYQAKTKMYLKSHTENHKFKAGLIKCSFCDFYVSTQQCLKRHEALHKNKESGEASTNNDTVLDESGPLAEPNQTLETSDNLIGDTVKNLEEPEVINKLPVLLSNEEESYLSSQQCLEPRQALQENKEPGEASTNNDTVLNESAPLAEPNQTRETSDNRIEPEVVNKLPALVSNEEDQFLTL